VSAADAPSNADPARLQRALAAADGADTRVMSVMQASFEPAIAARVELHHDDGAPTADRSTDQGRAAMARDVEARLAAGLDIQVLGDTAGDVGRPARIAARVSQRLGQMEDVHPGRGGELGEWDHAATSL
jgi:hypothetical protein